MGGASGDGAVEPTGDISAPTSLDGGGATARHVSASASDRRRAAGRVVCRFRRRPALNSRSSTVPARSPAQVQVSASNRAVIIADPVLGLAGASPPRDCSSDHARDDEVGGMAADHVGSERCSLESERLSRRSPLAPGVGCPLFRRSSFPTSCAAFPVSDHAAGAVLATVSVWPEGVIETFDPAPASTAPRCC